MRMRSLISSIRRVKIRNKLNKRVEKKLENHRLQVDKIDKYQKFNYSLYVNVQNFIGGAAPHHQVIDIAVTQVESMV